MLGKYGARESDRKLVPTPKAGMPAFSTPPVAANGSCLPGTRILQTHCQDTLVTPSKATRVERSTKTTAKMSSRTALLPTTQPVTTRSTSYARLKSLLLTGSLPHLLPGVVLVACGQAQESGLNKDCPRTVHSDFSHSEMKDLHVRVAAPTAQVAIRALRAILAT